jgi:hypothetical protein
VDEFLRDSIVRAIVHLNFDESEEALKVLTVALFELNWSHLQKEKANGNRIEYAA